jgi:hypothetical protein
MKVPFPKATVFQKGDGPGVEPVAICTSDGPAIFLAFEEWKLAVAFCRRNRNAGIELSPIQLDRGREQFKEVFRSRCSAPGNEDSFFLYNPETLWDEEVAVVNAQQLLKAEGNQIEARMCELEWPADELVDRGNTTMQVDFFHYVGRSRRRIGKVAFFALPLDDRNQFSCIPEHLITFDEAKWIAGELEKGGSTGRMRYYTWQVRAAKDAMA